MNQAAEDAITAMLNCFPQTSQNYDLLFETLGRLCESQTDQAIIRAAECFAAGDVPEQSMKFAPSGPEFVAEARKQQEYLEIKARPRLPAPTYRPGPLAPFQIRQQRILAENSHLPVLFEDVSFDVWKKLSAGKQIPAGAKWCAALGIVYGPAPKQIQQAAE